MEIFNIKLKLRIYKLGHARCLLTVKNIVHVLFVVHDVFLKDLEPMLVERR